MLHCSGQAGGSENAAPERHAQLQLPFAMHEGTMKCKELGQQLEGCTCSQAHVWIENWASCRHDEIIGSRLLKSEHVLTMVEYSDHGCPECQGKNGSLPHLRAVIEFILSGRDISLRSWHCILQLSWLELCNDM